MDHGQENKALIVVPAKPKIEVGHFDTENLVRGRRQVRRGRKGGFQGAQMGVWGRLGVVVESCGPVCFAGGRKINRISGQLSGAVWRKKAGLMTLAGQIN